MLLYHYRYCLSSFLSGVVLLLFVVASSTAEAALFITSGKVSISISQEVPPGADVEECSDMDGDGHCDVHESSED